MTSNLILLGTVISALITTFFIVNEAETNIGKRFFTYILTRPTRRLGMASMWYVLVLFLGALFIGQILIPQLIIFLVPALSFLFSNPSANLSLGFLQFNLLGFIVSGAITLPVLIIILRRANTGNIAAQG